MREREQRGDSISMEVRGWLILGALIGAIIGAKILVWVEHLPQTAEALSNDPALLIGGKTVVGALLGGMIAVETVKWYLGIKVRTGDVYATPIIVSIAIGRIGCFLSGMSDMTHGVHTNLPWAVDFGDGFRHPTQLYEIVFLGVLLLMLNLAERRAKNIPRFAPRMPTGQRFRWFMMGYLAWRLAIDSIKPHDTELLWLSPIQWVCLIALAWYSGPGRIEVLDGDASLPSDSVEEA